MSGQRLLNNLIRREPLIG